tara:strand:- start:62 stop:907 length:846 start_codon:yes stop_codon:yes gene_type:complete
MTGITIDTPIKHIRSEILINPKLTAIINSPQSNSNRISNEVSTNNNVSISNQRSLNRYGGTDKLDNSQRISYGFEISRKRLSLSALQNYEFSKNSNYHWGTTSQQHYLSDAHGNITYGGDKNSVGYNVTYDVHLDSVKSQSLSYTHEDFTGLYEFTYLDTKKITNDILENDSEILNYSFKSKKFKKYSTFNIKGSYDMRIDNPKEYSLGYNYYDECFGINLGLSRKEYNDDQIKPTHTLTLLFAFKNLGSYASTNLAVSELDKQDIEWEAGDIDNTLFYQE